VTNWIGVLRMGALLSLGWVIAAVLAWEVFGVLWAAAVLFVWVFLIVRFHRAVEALARSVASRANGDAEP
jgi:hypothetical protein